MGKTNVTVSLSSENDSHLNDFVASGYFSEAMDGYKFAIAYAIDKELSPIEIAGKRKTKYAIGNLDPVNELRDAVKFLHPKAPQESDKLVDFMQALAEAGIRDLAQINKENYGLDISELISNR